MDRRDFITDWLTAAAAMSLNETGSGVPRGARNATSLARSECARIAVLAELGFPTAMSERAASLLADLARATQEEPGCERYVVARDLTDPGRFHLSEVWKDLGALAAHFETPHMAAFDASARALGYTAPFLKQISIATIADFRPRELKPQHACAHNEETEG